MAPALMTGTEVSIKTLTDSVKMSPRVCSSELCRASLGSLRPLWAPCPVTVVERRDGTEKCRVLLAEAPRLLVGPAFPVGCSARAEVEGKDRVLSKAWG